MKKVMTKKTSNFWSKKENPGYAYECKNVAQMPKLKNINYVTESTLQIFHFCKNQNTYYCTRVTFKLSKDYKLTLLTNTFCEISTSLYELL